VPHLSFQCSECGYKSSELQWQCPQCKQWDTLGLTNPVPMDAGLPTRPVAKNALDPPGESAGEKP
jgi:predicted ATP-dependent serine protease